MKNGKLFLFFTTKQLDNKRITHVINLLKQYMS